MTNDVKAVGKMEAILIDGKYWPARTVWCVKCNVKMETVKNAGNLFRCPVCGEIIQTT